MNRLVTFYSVLQDGTVELDSYEEMTKQAVIMRLDLTKEHADNYKAVFNLDGSIEWEYEDLFLKVLFRYRKCKGTFTPFNPVR